MTISGIAPGEHPRLRMLRQALDEAESRLKRMRLDDPDRGAVAILVRIIDDEIGTLEGVQA